MLAITVQGAAGDHSVDMDMLIKPLPPDMQHHGDAHVAADPAGIATKFQQGVCGSMEQQSINDPGVTLGQGIEPVGQCEDQVPVIDIEEVGTLAFEPTLFGQGLALRAVEIPAGAITDGDGPAVIAL